jgi:nitroreductase
MSIHALLKANLMTNPVIETIGKRRSVRSYEPKPLPSAIIKMIIEAGNQAPSRGRLEKGIVQFQPWRFVVVENAEFRLKLIHTTRPIWRKSMESMKETLPEMYEKVMTDYEAMDEPKDMVYHSAPIIIFVIGPASYAVSCALACENMMIAASSLGLGSCYVGFGAMVKGDADIVAALELKDDERIYGPIVLGYPKEESDAMASIRPKKKEPIVKWI